MAGSGDQECASYVLGDARLRSGDTLPAAQLSYATWGRLNAARDNCVLLLTYYAGTHRSYAPLIGPGRALDPSRHFIVSPNLFGNGVSTSPSHLADRSAAARFPAVTIEDNVRCQHRLLVDHLGVERVALVTGWSLGAVQSYHWAALFPDMVAALLPVCGAARCWPLNRVFLEGVRAALRADPTFCDGVYGRPPVAGLRAFGRTYAGWAYSAAFFRERLYRGLGHESLADFLDALEEEHLAWDANDLLAMLWTWEHADLGAIEPFEDDLAAALGSIRARAIVMPCDQDAYCTLAENEIEAGLLRDAELRPLRSPYGHCAGAPGRFREETAFFEQAMRELLAP